MYETAAAVVYAPFGKRVYSVGNANEETWDIGVSAYSTATGVRLWLRRHDGASHGADRGTDAAITPDGRILFAGGWRSTRSGRVPVVLAYRSTTGARLWMATLPFTTSYAGPEIHVSPNGATVVVASQTGTSSSERLITVRAFSSTTGSPQWSTTINGPVSGIDQLGELTIAEGRVFVAGELRAATMRDGFVDARRLSDGERIWLRAFDSPNDLVMTTAAAVAGDVIVAVQRIRVGGSNDSSRSAAVALATADGEELWARDLVNGNAHVPDVDATHEGRRVLIWAPGGAAPTGTSLDPDTGAVHWTREVGSVDAITADGRTYFSGGYGAHRPEGTLVIATGFDAGTGDGIGSFTYDDRDDLQILLEPIAVDPTGSKIVVGGSTATAQGPDGHVWYNHHDHLLVAHQVP